MYTCGYIWTDLLLEHCMSTTLELLQKSHCTAVAREWALLEPRKLKISKQMEPFVS